MSTSEGPRSTHSEDFSVAVGDQQLVARAPTQLRQALPQKGITTQTQQPDEDPVDKDTQAETSPTRGLGQPPPLQQKEATNTLPEATPQVHRYLSSRSSLRDF